MSDSSANDAPRRSDPVEALRVLAQAPQRRAGANTETVVQLFPDIGVSRRTTGTDLVDVRAFAESIMFDATALVSRLDQIARDPEVVTDQAQDSVGIARVLQGGAAIVGSFATVCLVGNQISGTILLHPLLAWLLILSSIGFYAMGKVRP